VNLVNCEDIAAYLNSHRYYEYPRVRIGDEHVTQNLNIHLPQILKKGFKKVFASRLKKPEIKTQFSRQTRHVKTNHQQI